MDLKNDQVSKIIQKFSEPIDGAELYEMIVSEALRLTKGAYASFFLPRGGQLTRSFVSKKNTLLK